MTALNKFYAIAGLGQIRTTSLMAVVIVMVLMSAPFSQALDGTWTNNANGNWSVGSNWQGGTVADGADSTATLDNVITGDRTITLDIAPTIGNVTVLDTDKNYAISGANTLTLDVTSGSPTLSVPSGRTLTISSVIAGSDGFTKTGDGILTLSGNNTYSGGLVVNAGQVNFNQDYHFGDAAGALTFNGATVYLNDDVTVYSMRPVVVNPAANVIKLQGNGHWHLGGPVSGTGGVLFQGNPNGNISARLTNLNNTVTGELGLNSGSGGNLTVELASLLDGAGYGNIYFMPSSQQSYFQWATAATNALVMDNRQIEFRGDGTTTATIQNNNTSPNNGITINTDLVVPGTGAKSLTLNAASGPTNVFAGKITDGTGGATVSITKAGAGKWVLFGTNTYSGGTTVSQGTLEANSTNSLGAGNVTVSSTSAYLLIGAEGAMTNTTSLYLPSATTKNITLNADLSISRLFIAGVEYPAGTYTSSGAGSAWMNAGSGALIVGAAAVQPLFWDSDGGTPGAGGATPTGIWGVDSYWSSSYAGDAATAAWTAGRTATFAAGTDASGTYTVTVDGTKDIGGLTFEDGTVTVSGGTALKLVTNALAYVAASRTATIATPITEDATARQLTKSGAGTLTLSAANSHSGGTVLSAGILSIDNNAALGTGTITLEGGTIQSSDATARTLNNPVILSGNTTVGGAGNLTFSSPGAGSVAAASTLTVSSGLTATIASAMGGSGALTKAGAGTLILAGTNTYSGATTVSGGRLVIDSGQINSSGAVTFSSDCTLVITNGGKVFSGGSQHFIGTQNCNAKVMGGASTALWDLGGQQLLFQNISGNNHLFIDGGGVAGGAVVTNIGSGTSAYLYLGRSTANCSIVVTNGAQMFVNGKTVLGATYYATGYTNATNNSIFVSGGVADSMFSCPNGVYVGGGGTENGGSDRPGSSWSLFHVGAGGVVTNTGYNSGNRQADFVVGYVNVANAPNPPTQNNRFEVDGGKAFLMGNLSVGYSKVASEAISNAVRIANGGWVDVPGYLNVGWADGTSATGSWNSVSITNGGHLVTGANSYIGYAPGNTREAINNATTVGGTYNGTNALWDLGGNSLAVGYSTGTGVATGNVLRVNYGGVVTNISTLTVNATNTLELGAGGQIYAGSVTNSGTLAVTIDGGASPACGRLDVTGNLNLNNTTLDVTINANPGAPCVIASYGSLTGGFAATNGLTSNHRLEMDYQNSSQIAIIYAAGGTVIMFR